MNYLKTAILLAGMTALFMGVGLLIGGAQGMLIALVVAIGMNAFAYWNSGNMVLSMYGAQEVDRHSAPDLYAMTEEMAHRAGLPMPKLYIIQNDQPNAFATGRDPSNAAVAVNTGLLDMLSREEVAGVVAHELAHIKNRDTLIMTITATFAGAISMLANFGAFFGNRDNNNAFGMVGSILMMILAPLAASVVQMAISRAREYEADKLGAEICGRPVWLASALARISGGAGIYNVDAERNPATAHMFIVNPLAGEGMDNLFSTHPATQNRIAALEQHAVAWGQGDFSGRGAAPAQDPWAGRRSARRGSSVPPTRRNPWG